MASQQVFGNCLCAWRGGGLYLAVHDGSVYVCIGGEIVGQKVRSVL